MNTTSIASKEIKKDDLKKEEPKKEVLAKVDSAKQGITKTPKSAESKAPGSNMTTVI
jgi:hypothetical protein